MRKELNTVKGEYELSKKDHVSLEENVSKICTKFSLYSKIIEHILSIQISYYNKSILDYEGEEEEINCDIPKFHHLEFTKKLSFMKYARSKFSLGIDHSWDANH